MINLLIRSTILTLLWLRYRIRVHGLREIRARGTKGILFLPTHPALIDPVILATILLKDFAARPIANQDSVDLPGIRWLVGVARGITIPAMSRYGASAVGRIREMVAQVAKALKAGDNIILYPSGYLLSSRLESLGGNSGVEGLLREAPDVRIVLVRTRGLWGSSFGLQSMKEPDIPGILQRGIRQILSNFLFFTPRRRVDLTFVEPEDFPRTADRTVINPYLERFYNENAPAATYVPYTLWEREGRHELPDPDWRPALANIANVPAATRELVYARLKAMSGITEFTDTARLASDLSMDSLARAELMAWLETEFGFPQGNTDSLQTVGDVLLAAFGEVTAVVEVSIKPPAEHWFKGDAPEVCAVAPGETIAECFLHMARRLPNRALVADQTSGVRTCRELVMSVLALLPAVKALPGDCLGIMLPASVAAVVSYLTAVFAERTPVMLNWTVGRRNMLHGLELTGTQRILTSKVLVARLQSQGVDLAGIEERFVYLEALGAALTKGDKLRALLASRLNWRALTGAKVSPTAAILFTSGSESLPKAVPLTHANILADLRDVLPIAKLRLNDRLLGMLPPFHSFGITGNIAVTLAAGLRTVYYPNPTEGPVIARMIDIYQATMIIGTPTFLNGILRSAATKMLASLRLAVAGAEETPQRVYDLLAARAPHLCLIEGYGITECSPIVAINPPEAPKPHTIGQLMPSLDYALLDPETGVPAMPGAPGMLLLRGPSIFDGYLGDAPDPFVEFDGKRWYRTGDLVRRDADGYFVFTGRLKRFIKLGGEMISLPAIESVLLDTLGSTEDEGPILAVVATADEHPELVLFTIKDIDRERANALLRAAGLAPLYNLRRVERVEAIPTLGTGKTDYRTLQSMVK